MMAAQPSAIATLQARVAEHPWRTLGTAFLLGAWLGLEPPRAPRSAFARAAFAMVGSIALRVVREIALGNLVEHMVWPEARGATAGMPRGTSDAPIH
jgi:hypothetical protein